MEWKPYNIKNWTFSRFPPPEEKFGLLWAVKSSPCELRFGRMWQKQLLKVIFLYTGPKVRRRSSAVLLGMWPNRENVTTKSMNPRCFHSRKIYSHSNYPPPHPPRKFVQMFVLNNTVCDSQFGGLTVGQEGAGQAPSRTKGTWLGGEDGGSGGWECRSQVHHCTLWQVTWALLGLLSSPLKWAGCYTP